MSWQTPEGDPPATPAGPPSEPIDIEPDAETARVPVSEEPSTGGIISAEPVGWTGSAGTPGDPAGQRPDAPSVAWVLPPTVAPIQVAEGLVIAGVFARVVAYFVDVLLLGALNLIAFGILGGIDRPRDDTPALILSAVLVGVDLVYFVGLWTSGLQGTLGMRMLRLRILGARTAQPISMNDAVLRWIALTGAISILTLVPGLVRYIGLISLLWLLMLLITTATNPLRQGIHDRWARSVVVQPAPGGSGIALATCLMLVVLFGVLLPIGLLALAGDQFKVILSQIGSSI